MVSLGATRLVASHFLGAAITYECLGGGLYRIDFHYYGDCQGLTPTAYPTFVGVGSGCSAPTVSSWTLVSATDASYLAPTLPTTCGAGPYPGMRDYHFTATANFAGATCTQYNVQYTECCRSGSITNISNPASVGGGVFTQTIDLSVCNSSPVWHNPVPSIALVSRDNHFDLGGTDPDSDSLVYALVAPLDQNLAPVPYAVGHSVAAPMGPNWDVRIDSETGLLSVLPQPGSTGVVALAVEVEEYRSGVLVGRVHRAFQLRVLAALPANQLPTIAGPANVSGATAIGGDIVVAPGASACMDFSATDLDPGVATQLGWMSDLEGATLTDTFGTGPDTVFAVGPWARVCWTAPNRLGVDTITVTAIDTTRQLNNMVILRQGVRIGDPALVWPGDANNDLVADAFDLLPIGVAMASTGPARPGASNTWVGQPSTPWLDTIPGNVDKKFIDCDGNGTVQAADTIPLSLNYGLTHPKALLPMGRGLTTDPPLRLELPDSASVGDTISAPIILGDASVPANGVLGFAFRIQYDPALIDSSTFWVEFTNSWVAPSGNPLTITRNNAAQHHCDGALVRTTHTPVSGMGEVARAHFVIIDNIDGKRAAIDSAQLSMAFLDARVVDALGQGIPFDAMADSMTVFDRTVEQQAASPSPGWAAFPNPAHDRVTLQATGGHIEAYEILNLQGQVVMAAAQLDRARVRVELGGLAQGLYLLRVQVAGQWQVQRLVHD